MLREPSELERILALPILDPQGYVPDLTARLKRPGGIQTLRPIQSKALLYAQHFGGLFAPIGVGFGKTLICALLPIVLDAKRPLLFIPPSQRADLAKQWQIYAKHWILPRNLEVRTYDLLSSPDSTALLTNLQPDLIICDEAHKLSDQKSARTRRFLRYMSEHETVTFCALSGSFTAKSVKDYAHLAACALGERSPLPRKYGELEEWSRAIDVFRKSLAENGFDLSETGGNRALARANLQPLCDRMRTPEIREAYQRRLLSCPGVVGTRESAVDIPIRLTARTPVVPAIVKAWIEYFEATWTTPAGEEIEDALAFARVSRQLALGFFYRWIWPNNRPDHAWLDARAAWHKALRAYLPTSREGRDSPFLAAVACERGADRIPGYLSVAWSQWKAHKDKLVPPTEAVWIDPFIVRDAIAWEREQGEPVLIWYENTAVGAAIAREGGFTFADVGNEANALLANMQTARTVVLSVDAHATGKNLQLWHSQLVLSPSSNGRAWEQLIGRTHRPGQPAKSIGLTYYDHADCFASALRNAREDARYIEATLNTPQKLNLAVFD